ncbi:MAG TPA: hypothetical protein VLD37_00755 [Candidatus Bilamarchaeum sp.]|nr:hypothetical protein [Candidatus Bilamarchaeum sp.]
MALRQKASAGPLTAEAVERIFREAGLGQEPGRPPQSFYQLLAETGDAGRARLARDAMRAVKPPAMLDLLANRDVAAAFIRDPKGFAFHMSQLGQCVSGRSVGVARQGSAAAEDETSRLTRFMRERVAAIFAASPAAFVRIARLDCSYEALRAFESGSLGSAFRAAPDRFAAAIEQISAHAGGGGAVAFIARLRQDRSLATAFGMNPSAFAAFAAGTRSAFIPSLESAGAGLTPAALIARMFSVRDEAAIELGRPIDDLHERARERSRFVSGLGLPQVAGLLSSNPEFFYTSSNNLLFDALRRQMPGSGIRQIRDAFSLNDAQLRNFVFRAVNYGRLGDFLLSQEDVRAAISIIVGSRSGRTGVYSDSYDSRYYYLLANSVASVMRHAPDLARTIDARISELGANLASRPEAERRIYHALRYVRFLATGQGGSDPLLARQAGRSTFSPGDYRGRDGIVNVLQVFDREDTQRSHWPLTQRFFERGYRMSGRRRVRDEGGQEAGTLVTYERRGVRVSLFMGDTEEANRAYAKRWLSENATGMITFRGHSYSLAANMPPDVFGGRAGRYVFIPGSCGSAGSIPAYISSNPATDLRFFSNTSTGRGQVTNTLLELLLARRGSATFEAILRDGSRRITAAGGDVSLIRAVNPGECLLNYVNSAIRGGGPGPIS